MNRISLIVSVSLLSALLSGCLGENKAPPTRTDAAVELEATSNRAKPELNVERINSFGFQVYWDSFIRDEVIRSVSLEGDMIYVFTKSKRLYQVDMHSGMVNWVYDVGRPLNFIDGGHPITEWTYAYFKDEKTKRRYKQYDEIFFIAGDHLYALDKKNGSELWQIYLSFTPASAPQASKTHVFAGSWDDRVYAIRKDRPLIPDWSWRTNRDVVARPAVYNTNLFVSSTDGNMYVFEGATGKRKPVFPTERGLQQDPLVFRALVYLPGDDFNLYAIGAADGLLHYRFCAGAPISGRPVGVEKSIYFPAGKEGMFALGRTGPPTKEEGNPRKMGHKLLWQRKGATQVLTKGLSDVYLLEPGEAYENPSISRIGAVKGNYRDGVNFGEDEEKLGPAPDFFLTNPFSPKSLDKKTALKGGVILMGYRNGWIFALKETATIPGA